MEKPTAKELGAALGTLLAEYADMTSMLDDFASCGPEGMSLDEGRRYKASIRAYKKILKLYQRAVG